MPKMVNRKANSILLLGIPPMPDTKVPKFKLLIEKKVIPKLAVGELKRIEIDVVDGKTTGKAILEFNYPEVAVKAANKLDRFKLTSKITF